jgi:hypothetical protein
MNMQEIDALVTEAEESFIECAKSISDAEWTVEDIAEIGPLEPCTTCNFEQKLVEAIKWLQAQQRAATNDTVFDGASVYRQDFLSSPDGPK